MTHMEVYPILPCSHCGKPTRHTHEGSESVRTGKLEWTINWIFACEECGTRRIWGNEELVVH